MIPRLFIDASLEAGAGAPLTAEQAHYLKNVLRRAAGDDLRLFNGRDGEFAATIAELKKKGGVAAVHTQTRIHEPEPDLWLCFAPVKRGPLETIVQKAVEIGVARLIPVSTERTVASKLNIQRLQVIVLEAAEQCGRLTVPSVSEPIKLNALIEGWPADRRLIFCDEAGDNENEEWGGPDGRAVPLLEALTDADSKADDRVNNWRAEKSAIVTGPEGGFAPSERKYLRSQDFVTAATLGPRILRADTAAIAALVLWQAARGDWRKK
ncbi:MAG: 16S rRNA (uracil(1498)-N(3))-methyltransferase [Pseudomonadota bacterium]